MEFPLGEVSAGQAIPRPRAGTPISTKNTSIGTSQITTNSEDVLDAKILSILRRIRTVHNRLTPKWNQQIRKQITDLQITTEEDLKLAMDRIFEKAVSEPNTTMVNFCVVYAHMCHSLMEVGICLFVLRGPFAHICDSHHRHFEYGIVYH